MSNSMTATLAKAPADPSTFHAMIEAASQSAQKKLYGPGIALTSNPMKKYAHVDFLTSIDDAWNAYSGAMQTFLGGGGWPDLQLVSLADLQSAVNWDDPTYGDYYFNKVTCDLVNALGGTYGKTNRSFSETYGDFINDIFIPQPNADAQSQAKIALGNLLTDEQRHNTVMDNLNLAWQAFDASQRNGLPPSAWESYDDWWIDGGTPGGAVTGPQMQYNQSRELLLTYYQTYRYWLQQAFNGGETIANILQAYDISKKVKVKIPATNANTQTAGTIEVWPYQISESYSTWLANAKNGVYPRTSLNVDKNTFRYNLSQSTIAGGLGISLGFFGAIAGGVRNTITVDTQSTNFKLQFEGVFKTFNFIPGDWYKSDTFGFFKNGPFFPNSPSDTLNRSGALFSRTGLFNYEPTQAFVVYAPKVTITFDSDTYHYFEQTTQGFAGFCIGPFVVGGGSYYDHEVQINRNDDDFTFSFEISNYAILIGFNSQQLF